MKRTTQDQHVPADYRTFYSSNVVEGELCFRHAEPPQAIGPAFSCESCGGKFCPVCATGVWQEGVVGRHRYVWYRCPFCPIGLAFIALPLAGSVPREGVTSLDLWNVRAGTDPMLEETRPGAYYRLLPPTVKRQGSYQAFWDGRERCFLQLDGREWVSWVQRANSVQLAIVPAVSHEALVALEEGEYLLDDPPAGTHELGAGRDAAPLALFLQLPQGFQEYEIPEGWPWEGTTRPLRITDRIWTREGLKKVLPGLSGAVPQGVPPTERGSRGVTEVAEPQRRVA